MFVTLPVAFSVTSNLCSLALELEICLTVQIFDSEMRLAKLCFQRPEHVLTITTTVLHEEFISTEALEDWEQHWLSSISTSSTVRLKSLLSVLSRECESKPIKVDRVPEARIGDIDIDYKALALEIRLATSMKRA